MNSPARPRFSLVCAASQVGRHLPGFIASLEAQTHGLDDVEIIMVDDGSPDDSADDSAEILDAWATRRPDTVRVLHQADTGRGSGQGAGQGAGRNAGIAVATGAWISFPDPDDTLAPTYLAEVADFLDTHPDADLVACRRLMWNEETGDTLDEHPLRSMYRGNPYVDLAQTPERFHGHSPTSFFHLDRVRDLDLTFDTRIRPTFEDGHFNCRYLLDHPHPKVGFLETATYHERLDGSSGRPAAAHPDRYTLILDSFLDLARRAVTQYGEVPGWLATSLLHELSWYVAAPDAKGPPGRPVSGAAAGHVHEIAAEILGLVDVDRALPFVPPAVTPLSRHVLAHGYRGGPWHDSFVQLGHLDVTQELVRASYFFTGEQPEETWWANGEPITPLHAKIRDFSYYGRALLHERIVWLPADRTLTVDLDGSPTTLTYEPPLGSVKVAPPGQIRWWLSADSARVRATTPEQLRVRRPASRQGRLAQKLRHLPTTRRKYADAWVLMDRIHDAADSGEILFRYLREHRPEINAWFVLEKGGPEWNRFKAAGHGDRLVAHGSLQWRLLMAHAAHLLSSHAEDALIAPAAIREFTPPNWRFHFLQHGVIKDDLSSWLDPKKIETFVVSTPQELASVAGDHTSYVFTTREVALTGLPRFDRLREVGLRFPPERRDLLLVAPTWRNELTPPFIPGTQRRPLDRSLLETDFLRRWLAYLTDPELADATRDQGVTLAFLPHPILQPLRPFMELPAQVRALSYEGQDPQELFARSRAVVTDFSSIAFNAAYLDRPVVYYQFDADSVFTGGHVGRRGYFDYARDGFGPVVETHEAAVDATVAALAHGPSPLPEYQARIDATFTLRDGRCCERVVARILETGGRRSVLPPTPTPTQASPAG